MSVQVIATAGHVDHGKSTLIRALTGMDPDRWEEEKRRGLTIDLGFAWTTLPSGREIAFVDVPGHERFLGNTLAGLGPASVVCFVVAADEGWRQQSTDHRDAVAALGIDRGVLVLTRSDLAPHGIDEPLARMRVEFAGTGLEDAPAVAVSAVDGTGMDALRSHLDEVLAGAPAPRPDRRMRLWVDRSFTITGAGTVVTGTLGAGTLRRDDRLELAGAEHSGPVTVRGLHSRDRAVDAIAPVSRAAVNLRGVTVEQVGRGDALLTPGAWSLTAVVDVRRATGADLTDAPEQLMVHIGTAAVPARVRPLGQQHARLTLARALPLQVGDQIVLRGTDERAVHAGVHLLDVDPPPLDRRGAGRRRTAALVAMPWHGDLAGEVSRYGAVRADTLTRSGLDLPDPLPASIRRIGPWMVDAGAFEAWRTSLREHVQRRHREDPLLPGVTRGAAADLLGLSERVLLEAVIDATGLVEESGHIREHTRDRTLGSAEPAVTELEHHLDADPFNAPEADDLKRLRLGTRELAAAARHGRLLRLDEGVVLLPTAPARAMRVLAGLDQPFTTSQARRALGTTRRTAIPLLEHLDARGWTRRLDAGHREVVR